MSESGAKTIVFPGVSMIVDGCTVCLFNVVKTTPVPGSVIYLVSQVVECYGKKSKQFIIYARSQEEYMRKLKNEIALFKAIILAGAYDTYKSG
ncbi:MAG: hypothetical protein DSO07_05165 [Thermoproteota archaeon]|nr:MAG: hypothetical protein DSO07_05165 [Candidatus Korarchaeota archaeon]